MYNNVTISCTFLYHDDVLLYIRCCSATCTPTLCDNVRLCHGLTYLPLLLVHNVLSLVHLTKHLSPLAPQRRLRLLVSHHLCPKSKRRHANVPQQTYHPPILVSESLALLLPMYRLRHVQWLCHLRCLLFLRLCNSTKWRHALASRERVPSSPSCK